jgi:hypothetical protein
MEFTSCRIALHVGVLMPAPSPLPVARPLAVARPMSARGAVPPQGGGPPPPAPHRSSPSLTRP